MVPLVLLLYLLSRRTAAVQCPVYTCGALGEGQCLEKVNGSDYTVQPCPAQSICDLSSPTAYCVPGLEDIRYPGEMCESDWQCSSSKCSNSRCEGKRLNETCANPYDCEGGLYCDLQSTTCVKHIEEGQLCASEYQCQSHCLCSMVSLTNSTRICMPYFSVPTGNAISSVISSTTGLNYACYSMFAVLVNDHYICQDAVSSNSTLPILCESDADCRDNSGKFQGKCECSMSGEAYCSLFPLDEPVQTVGRLMMKFMYENDECNTYSRFGFFCLINDLIFVSDVYELVKHKEMIETGLYTQVAHSPECAISVLFPDFYALLAADKRQKASPCLNFTCDSTLKESACSWQTNEIQEYALWQTVHFAECPNETVCLSGHCQAPITSPGYPGDPCNLPSDCMFNLCQNGTCVHAGEGAACSAIFSCDLGLYCAPTGKCAVQGGVDAVCESDYACENTLVCNQGACTAYYSLPVGARSYSSLACQSGYIETNQTDYISYCQVPPTTQGSLYLRPCNASVACKAEDGRELVQCTCGATDQGQCFCPLYPGDPPLQLAIQAYQALVSLNPGTACNTASRNTLKCYEGLEDWNPYYYYKLNITYYQLAPQIHSTAQCVLKNNLATSGYYQLLQDFQTYSQSLSFLPK